MKIAVIALTKNGEKLSVSLADKLQDRVDGEIDLYFKDSQDRDRQYYKEIRTFNSLKLLVSRLFIVYDALIFIMALGIVVRMIAPYLKNKKEDPAVVTVDESGQNAISTLSGHLGGANQITEQVANILEANPVITTATDCQHKLAFDLLAKQLNCKIRSFSNLTLANAALVNNNKINLYTDLDLTFNLAENVTKFFMKDFKDHKKNGLLVGSDIFPVIIGQQKIELKSNYLQLIPRNIIVGLGCCRHVSLEQIEAAIDSAFKKIDISKKSIKKLATIDLKKDEKAILKYVEKAGVPLEIIKRSEIKKANFEYTKSEFVKKMIGVGGVCEPAAMLSANKGTIILSKMSKNKVTVALVEDRVKEKTGNFM